MSDYMDLTAAQLADCLDLVPKFPHNTGALSQLDEATTSYGWKFSDAEVSAAHHTFTEARFRHLHSYRRETGNYSDESWQQAVAAATELARAMRRLGDVRLEHCQRPTGWGTCGFVLDDDGTCHGQDHEDMGIREESR